MEILIFWDASAPPGFQLPISRAISEILDMMVTVEDNPLILNGYIGSRRQNDARVVLDGIDVYKRRMDIHNPVLLVISRDIFMEGAEFLFGLARPSTGSAVVSCARLDNDYYGLRRDEDELLDRISKESAHELGHLFGLDHCKKPDCIMHNPITLDDLSRKRRFYCQDCKKQLEKNLDRYSG
ncbi:MAG TPA: archaemetzincin family Zn-dependent metalloprotease [Methanoregulaceae archaeon]|nr:archaemetzincin family Zn-dependent metalloprotease [Methanoregulaceae archaeon]